MDKVRLGVIGCGGMAQSHMGYFGNIKRMQFTAASDTFENNLKTVVDKYKVQGFADGYDLIKSGACDAVLIATPHYFHPPYSIAALKAGLHVLTEKPVSVTAAAAEEVMKVHAKFPKLRYAANFQMRSDPKWRKVKQLVESGAIGKITRASWNITTWFRTQMYYDSGSWRATWEGEGGGVLLNQCPHNLDLFCWIVGTPSRVHAIVNCGKHHNIEVDDEVVAMLEFKNGAVGTFVTSTAEHPGSDLLEIVGEGGKITVSSQLLGGQGIELVQTDISTREAIYGKKGAWYTPATTKNVITVPASQPHGTMMQNFIDSILDGVDLIAPADEGIHSVEMANAIIQSGLTHKSIDIPMNRASYEKLLKKLIADAKKRKKK